ncbi:MAG: branched-chain amino acid ABC transporter permease [Hyphomicrobiaceae bacterium]|nr:branched-chain amino acid ABC transporter permease [Hyphomicrobiaceae bacterium]
MNLYLIQVFNGLGIGMIYFLIAVGLTIIFGIMNFVNFAHGAFYLLGAYACYAIADLTGNFWLALVLGPVAVGIGGWLGERYFLSRLYRVPHMYQILVTLGLALVIQEMAVLIWGPIGKPIAPPEVFRGVMIFGNFAYPKYRLFLIGFTAILALALWLLLERTRYGAVLRAGTESTEMVSLLGINIFRVYSMTFALGAFLAGLAGVLAAPIRGAEPFMGPDALVIAFVVVVVGGLGSFAGALVGGIVVGIVQSVMSSFWSEGANIMIYVAMALVILLRPHGLLGRA